MEQAKNDPWSKVGSGHSEGEIEDLRRRLAEAEATILALRSGQTTEQHLYDDLEAQVDARTAELNASPEPLGTTVKELHVAMEELNAQNEALEAARARAEEERKRYQNLFDFAPDGYLVTSVNGFIRQANQAAVKMLGVDRDAVLHRSLTSFLAPEELDTFRSILWRLREEPEVRGWEPRLRSPGRDRFPALVDATAEDEPGGRAASIRWTVRDMTERRRAETEHEGLIAQLAHRTVQLEAAAEVGKAASALFVSAELIREVAAIIHRALDLYSVGVFLLDGDGETVVLNGSAGELGRRLLERRFSLPADEDSLIGWTVTHAQVRLLRGKDESPHGFWDPSLPRPRAQIAVPLVSRGQCIGALLMLSVRENEFDSSDIPALETMADHLANAIENARLHKQAQEFAALQERQRLARELHDSVSQMLFSASIISDVLPHLWDHNPEEGRRRVEELHRLTRGAQAEMRMLLLELRPATLAQTPLEDLLRQLAQALPGRSGIQMSLEMEPTCRIPGEVKIVFYRIAQEALTNMIKHSQANRAALALHCEPDPDGTTKQVDMRLVDDGRGFDGARVSPDHMGIRIMRERAESVGARLSVDSQAGQGTQVAVVWPAPLPAA